MSSNRTDTDPTTAHSTEATKPVDDNTQNPDGLSKNALKRLQKQQLKQEQAAEKAANKPAVIKKPTATTVDESELSESEYYQQRTQSVQQYQSQHSIAAYPHKFHANHSIPHAVQKYSAVQLSAGQLLDDTSVSIAGRILGKRSSGASLYFYELHQSDNKIQVVAMKQNHNDTTIDWSIHQLLRRGDIIGCVGRIGRSNTNELSLFASSVQLLSPCMRMLPNKITGLVDQETRYRQRYLDLMLNHSNRQIFYTRSKIINFVRRFLDQYGFLEVETPMMNIIPGGAAAKPFKTHHNDLKLDMFMRIAPELYLKQLVIGGLERVYEIGKQFRNEGIDMTHNPEFTTCEFYWAYADYEDLMAVTEQMVSGLVKELHGSYVIQYQPNQDKPAITVDFTPPFKRVNFIDSLEQATSTTFPTDLHTESARQFLDDLAVKHNVSCPEPRTATRLLDKMIGEFVEPTCISPTYICEHPAVMSPLSKTHRNKPHLVERFELFVLTKEICNAYTELNMPDVQRQRFQEQAKDKAAGDEEAQMVDEDYCTALDFGLPPTAGWGMGIDRLTMFLTNQDNIKEVLLFPAMKPIEAERIHHDQAVATFNDHVPQGAREH